MNAVNARLSRDQLRKKTCYRAGRTVVDVYLILSLIGAVCAAVAAFAEKLNQEWAVWIVAICVADSIVAFVAREIVHAIFDLADASLSRIDPLAEYRTPEKTR